MPHNMKTDKTQNLTASSVPETPRFDNVEDSLAEVKRVIAWLEYVPEHEFSFGERQRLMSASLKFARSAQPIAKKYTD